MPNSSYYLDAFISDGEIENVITDAITCIFDNVNEKIDDNFLATLQVPFTTKIAMEKVNKVIFLATFKHDGDLQSQEDSTNSYLPLENIDPDDEPIPNSIDSWARGSGGIIYYFSLFTIKLLLSSGNQENFY